MFLSALEVYHDTVPRSAAMNMALDEILWQSATMPLLRLYQWDHPAVSFGYFGRYADVARYESERELVRRCTGGGIVFHGNDLTYALIIPPNGQREQNSPMMVYALVHAAIQEALRDVGTEAELVPEARCRRFAERNAVRGREDAAGHVARRATSTDACFTTPVAFDVMIECKKVAGAAQRRSRRGLLQQGSIQNVEISEEFRKSFVVRLCENAVDRLLDSALVKAAHQLVETKYDTATWLNRR